MKNQKASTQFKIVSNTSLFSVVGTRSAEAVLVMFASAAFTAAYALWMGQDTNWDQRNYHVYTVHAWLRGRTFSDLAPAQLQTWLNPLPHLLQYLLIQTTPPVMAGLVMGALAGLNGLMLWLLARRLQCGDCTWHGRACACVIVLVGLTGRSSCRRLALHSRNISAVCWCWEASFRSLQSRRRWPASSRHATSFLLGSG
jgi:hypothetical protein